MTDNREQSLQLLVSEPDVQDALNYLELCQPDPELGAPNKEWVAKQLGITRRGLYYRIDRWTQSGALEKARRILFVPKAQATLEVIDELVGELPDIIRRQIKIAKFSESDFASNAAAKWLTETLAVPALNKLMQSSSSAEQEYLNTPRSFGADV